MSQIKHQDGLPAFEKVMNPMRYNQRCWNLGAEPGWKEYLVYSQTCQNGSCVISVMNSHMGIGSAGVWWKSEHSSKVRSKYHQLSSLGHSRTGQTSPQPRTGMHFAFAIGNENKGYKIRSEILFSSVPLTLCIK